MSNSYDGDSDKTGWERIPLGPFLRGELAPAGPVALVRADGVKLLYCDKLHWFSGEPESLKSWLAQVAVAQALADGMSATYVDFEGDATTIIERMRALGVEDPAIAQRLIYHRPEAPMTSELVREVIYRAAHRSVDDQAEEAGVAISVIDGVNAAMGASGLDSNSAKDFYNWWARLGRPLQEVTQGPMIAIDHVVKSSENRGQYASGTGQKLAAVDVHFGLEVIDPFGVGMTGRAKIVLHKDRPGRLRPLAVGRLLGRLVLESDAETGAVQHSIEPPSENADGKFRPTALMERVSKQLELSGDLTRTELRERVAGKAKFVVQAIDRLLEEGYISRTDAARGAALQSVQPYREARDS